MKEKVWAENLIWCPSQCYYYFTDPEDSQKYCIYLRWRHSDPWTVELIKCDDDWEFIWDSDWETIETSRDYLDHEYRKLEKEVLKIMGRRFSGIKFTNEIYEEN